MLEKKLINNNQMLNIENLSTRINSLKVESYIELIEPQK